MPSVTVHYFANLRETKGTSREEVTVETHESASDLYTRLFPGLSARGLSVGFAINRRHCSGDSLLSDGDEVAFIPPVGGG